MTDETNNAAAPIEAAKRAKKPYVKPQLHILSGQDSEGKASVFNNELDAFSYGPS